MGGAKNGMRSCVGGTEKPPAMGWDCWKVTKRNLCCWREASTAFPVPVGGSEQQRDLFPEPEAAVYGFRVLQGPAVADADAVEHGGAGMLRRLRYPQASALDHPERADR
jgi:hypothetical protein